MDETKDTEAPVGGVYHDVLFEKWWARVCDAHKTPELKSAAKAAWEDSVALTIGRVCALLWGEARKADAAGKSVSAQAIRFAATKIAELP